MSELLAVLSNPRRKGKKRYGKAKHRHPRGVMASIHTRSGKHVSRGRWKRSGYRRNPKRRGYRRNPIGLSMAGLGNDLVSATAGAAGGVAVDFVMRPMPLPLKAGPLNYLVRGVASIGLGILGQAVRLPYAAEVGRGALAITLYNAVRQYVLLPRGLGELSDDDITKLTEASEMNPSQIVGEYVSDALPAPVRLGEYLGEAPDLQGVGYVED